MEAANVAYTVVEAVLAFLEADHTLTVVPTVRT